MLTRLIDYMKMKGITAICTSLVDFESDNSQNARASPHSWIPGLSSPSSRTLANAIGHLCNQVQGMSHSNQIREYRITDHGVEILDVYLDLLADF
jgi:circadian clock protein KaiC